MNGFYAKKSETIERRLRKKNDERASCDYRQWNRV